MENKDKIVFLLFDVVMPKKNGKEAYREIKEINPDIGVLFISGYDKDLVQKKGVYGEDLNFISKPISPDMLLQRVRKCLDRKT